MTTKIIMRRQKMSNEYISVICNYCEFTESGTAIVNSNPWNLCEGRGCEKARERCIEETGEEPEE